MGHFPSLDDFGPTRRTLHLYTKAIGVILREHAIPHERWWHIGLRVTPAGLVSDNVPLPEGGVLALRMDLHEHQIKLITSSGDRQQFDMNAGLTGTQMGEALIAAVAEQGLHAEYQRQRFESDDEPVYEPEATRRFFTALVNADRIFKKHRASLSEEVSPVNLWPHGFDLSMECFGSRLIEQDKNGSANHLPAQLNLGFYPGASNESSYFYSNPWPFEADKLVHHPLPEGARWHESEWEGSILPYTKLLDEPSPDERILTYARAVHDLTQPILHQP